MCCGLGWVVCSAYDGVVKANDKALLKTDIAIAIPSDCYGRIGLSLSLAAMLVVLDLGARMNTAGL